MIVALADAQARLPDLIHGLTPGEEVVITEDEKPIARLVGEPKPKREPIPLPGFMKGQVLYMAPDFNEPLDDRIPQSQRLCTSP